jgi:O-antigen ligase
MATATARSLKRGILTATLAALLVGQVARIPITAGIAVTPADIFVLLYVLSGVPVAAASVRRRRLMPVIGAFAAAAVLSWLANAGSFPPAETAAGIAYALRFFLYAAWYFCLDADAVRFLKTALPVTGFLFAVLGIVQYAIYPSLRNLEYLGWDPHYRRLFSTVFDPNFAGIILLFTALSAVRLKVKSRWVAWVLTGVPMIALVLTMSRSSYLAAVASAVAVIVVVRRYRLLIAVAAITAIVLLATASANQSYSVFRVRTAVARLGSWRDAAALIAAKPVTGYGFDMLRSIQEPGFGAKDPWTVSHASGGVDNSLLFSAATMGIAGIIAFCWFVLTLWQVAAGRRDRAAAAAEIARVVGVLVHSQFINSMFYPWIFLWLVFSVREGEEATSVTSSI